MLINYGSQRPEMLAYNQTLQYLFVILAKLQQFVGYRGFLWILTQWSLAFCYPLIAGVDSESDLRIKYGYPTDPAFVTLLKTSRDHP
jgi:hypothetical protein